MKDKIQQIIVMRNKYPDGSGGLKKIRTGKMIAQGSHAAMAFFTNRLRHLHPVARKLVYSLLKLSKEEITWIEGAFTKICVYVEDESALLALHHQAKEKGLISEIIKDSGLTEFGGIPTHTAIAIGPCSKSKLDEITGHLPLL